MRSGRSTIQAEHHDRKVQLLINAVDFKKASKPYFWSIFFFCMFLFTLFLGILVTCLRFIYMNIILSVDKGESIGPLLIGGSFLFLGAGFKFLYDAYQTGARERQKIKVCYLFFVSAFAGISIIILVIFWSKPSTLYQKKTKTCNCRLILTSIRHVILSVCNEIFIFGDPRP